MKGRILVTGGSGFIGSHLIDALLERGCEVSDFGRTRYCGDVPFFKGDITRLESVRQALGGEEFDTVFHLVGLKSGNPGNLDMVNRAGTANLLERVKFKRIILSSTGAVYSPSPNPVSEDSPKSPVFPYGISKLAAEELIQNASGNFVFLRLFNVYGPRDDMVVSKFVERTRTYLSMAAETKPGISFTLKTL
jgi:UDP-glucose 4-epimerase